MAFTCPKCSAAFPKNQGLQKHLARKRPCDPILDKEVLPPDQRANTNRCRYCGRTYSRSDNLTRHLKICKIANSDEGMEKLMEHTLARQNRELRMEVAEVKAQMAELAALLRGRMTPAPREDLARISQIGVQNNGPVDARVTNVTVNQQINIRSFDGEDRLIIPASLVRAVFTENARLVEYCRLSDEEKTDPETAAPFVLEALVNIVKRAHKNPMARNVYLNPKRADQVLVFVESENGENGKVWEVRPLMDTIRDMFDSVAGNIHRIIVTDKERAQLPVEVQSSASWIPNLYEDEPDRYAREAKMPMAAHLSNMRPQLTQSSST